MPPEMTLLIAHRGASAEAPENTIPAIRKAWKRSADGVEIDIHITRDNRLAVIHDNDTGRVARVALPVESSTLAQLQALDVGRWKRKRYLGRRIPTLAQAITTIPTSKWLFAELKSGPRIAPFALRELIRNARVAPHTMVCSFKLDTLAAMRDEAQRRNIQGPPLGWIVPLPEVESLRDHAERDTLFWRAESAGCSWLSLHHSKAIDANFISAARAANFKVAVWTVDKESDAARLVRVGVDAIISNDPKRIAPYVCAAKGQSSSNQNATPAITPTRAAIPAWMDDPDTHPDTHPDATSDPASNAPAPEHAAVTSSPAPQPPPSQSEPRPDLPDTRS